MNFGFAIVAPQVYRSSGSAAMSVDRVHAVFVSLLHLFFFSNIFRTRSKAIPAEIHT